MSNRPVDKNLLPSLVPQNPAPLTADSQDRKDVIRSQVDRVMAAFYNLLPSNYVSSVPGPYYTLQFQAAAEQIAEFQVEAQEVLADSMYDYTRSEVLFQILGNLVFPDALETGYPNLDGDLTYRTFLQRMVTLLLQGATKLTMQEGIELLTTATVEIIERGIESRKLKGLSAWGPEEMFTFEVNLSQDGTALDINGDPVTLSVFPADLFNLQRNVQIVLRALKPAHVLYDYRHLFKETFAAAFTETKASYDYRDYKYQDMRQYWLGAKSIQGYGETLVDTTLFSDPTLDFTNIHPGAVLTLLSGPNVAGDNNATTPDGRQEGYHGNYRVVEILAFPLPNDPTLRAYTTSGGLSGTASVSNGSDVTDPLQVLWATASEGDTLTFLTGPNAGTYRLKTLLGTAGGPIGNPITTGTGPSVRVSPSILRIQPRMLTAASGQQYQVGVDRLGVQVPHLIRNEDVTSYFIGDPLTTRDFILTSRGPLVKAWGDMTPATKQDVIVWVSGVSVPISEVNPYIGKITLATPVTLFVEGDPAASVVVEYIWMASPVMEMAGLNTEGLVLNRWSRPGSGPHSPGSPQDTQGMQEIPYDHRGAPDLARFPLSVVLGPMAVPQPLLIGHRYLGFTKESSALLNSPTTLLLNQNPAQYQVPGFEQIPEGTTAAFIGEISPLNTTPVWACVGTDSGGVQTKDIVINGVTIPDSTYVVKDLQSGSFEGGSPTCAFYKQDVDLSFPSAVTVVARYVVDSTTLTMDGVFSGVGFGLHDDKRLYLVGNLVVNGVEHIGLLVNARYPHLLASWQIGPKVKATILSTTTATFPTAEVPTSLIVGNRFQVLSPQTQAGVYTISHLVRHTNGTTTVTVTTPFPADFTKYGNKYPMVLFEALWSVEPATYRMTLVNRVNIDRFGVRKPDKKLVQLSVSGLTTAFVTEFDDVVTATPQSSETSLALFWEATDKGTVFWGSLSYAAQSQSAWHFLRYGVIPDVTALQGYSQSVQTTMAVLPENEDNQAWFVPQAFGYSRIERGSLCLKSTSASETLNTNFGYRRNEPFFTKNSNLDLTATFQLDNGVLGAGDAEIVLNDGDREGRVATIQYYENGSIRQLARMPTVSMAGLIKLSEQGWAAVADPVMGTSYNHETDLVFDQVSGHFLRYANTLDMAALVAPDSGDRVIEATLAVSATYVTSGATGICLTADVGVGATDGVAVTLHMAGGVPQVRLVQPNGLVLVQAYPFDWTDGAMHTYRMVVSGTTVSLFVDEVFQAPSVNLGLFGAQGTGLQKCMFGVTDTGGVGQILWRAVSCCVVPHSSVIRTLGVWKGGDKNDINQWELPRTDSSPAANSELVGPVIEEMDWHSSMTVRILRTWTWGLMVLRPGSLPPYYSGPPADFATENAVPSAAWINVEYRELPYVPSRLGFVSFGSFDARAVTQQWWDDVSFRLFRPTTDDWKAPQHMVLNQATVINSGEIYLDATLESASIMPFMLVAGQGLRWVTLRPTHMYAQDIYKIVDGLHIYTRESWTFDATAQLVTLNANPDGTYVTFSGNPLTVVYYPGRPVTNTYLLAQPLLDSMTLLNEGTPPIPKSQQTADAKLVFAKGSYVSPGTYDDPATAPDPTGTYEALTFAATALYESLSFMTVDNGGAENLLAIASDGTLPVGFSGVSPTEGEVIYDETHTPTGLIGASIGAHVLALRGKRYMDEGGELKSDLIKNFMLLPKHGGAPLTFLESTLGKNLFWSGGAFLSPVVDGSGKVIGARAAGGNLNTGLILYPIKALR